MKVSDEELALLVDYAEADMPRREQAAFEAMYVELLTLRKGAALHVCECENGACPACGCDVDLIRKTWIRRNTKSGVEPLELPLPERLWTVLHERKEALQPHPRDLIAGRSMGHPNRPLREICHRADVPLISPIGLRHSCETFLAERGTAELFQTTYLGLKSPRMLWRHYRHVTGPTLETGAAQMNAR
jgi:integrase